MEASSGEALMAWTYDMRKMRDVDFLRINRRRLAWLFANRIGSHCIAVEISSKAHLIFVH